MKAIILYILFSVAATPLINAEEIKINWVKTDTIYETKHKYVLGNDTLSQQQYDALIEQKYLEEKARQAGYQGKVGIAELRKEIMKGNPEAIEFAIKYLLNPTTDTDTGHEK